MTIDNIMQKNVRLLNRQKSIKNGGSSDIDSRPYLIDLGVELIIKNQPIQFLDNRKELIHRWAPYVQGFSASFVQSQFELYKGSYQSPVILDPFAGCGTVLVQAKRNGFLSYGTELNPLLHYVANTKLNSWDVSPEKLLSIYYSLPQDRRTVAPDFLHFKSHFNPGVLSNLEIIKGSIDSYIYRNEEEKKIKDLLLLAFSSILIDSSNLVRSPCLGYSKKKNVSDETPRLLMDQKVSVIAHDLRVIQHNFLKFIDTESMVYLANAKEFEHKNSFDLVVTSPPYMNGMDYVINYKIEMGWLGFAEGHKELKKLKDEMVVCDNVSKGMIREFSLSDNSYTNQWLEIIKRNIIENIKKRGSYRRMDMPYIVHKYFDDMYQVMKHVITTINNGGRFILVVGDSLIADVYVPTDLLIAKIGKELGLEIERIEKVRIRRSGQIRSYKLRESIITLKKV